MRESEDGIFAVDKGGRLTDNGGMQKLTEELLTLASQYSKLTGYARATVATMVMNDGKFFDRIERGGGYTVNTYVKVKDWFSQNMPHRKNNDASNTDKKGTRQDNN